MKNNLIFVLVILALAANEAEERTKQARVRYRNTNIRETLWSAYDQVADRFMDQPEKWKIIKQPDYGTN